MRALSLKFFVKVKVWRRGVIIIMALSVVKQSTLGGAHREFDIEIHADLSKNVEFTLKFLGTIVPVIIKRKYLSLGNLKEYN